MVDFYLAQTQEAGPQRVAALTKSIKDFDAIYQNYREVFLGWRHTSGTRILQELASSLTPRTLTKKSWPATSGTS